MRVLGLQGSPRKKGSTAHLLAAFMKAAEKRGAITQTIPVCRKNILPCRELTVCEKKGLCPIDDDMKHEVYSQLRWADVIVAASPVFFYSVTAQLKALIDRSQTLWARKYRLKLTDPGASTRLGCLISVGATRGKSLFEGINLTAKYFYDAVDAKFTESLTYRGIETPKDMTDHPTAMADIGLLVERLLKPFSDRKKVLFACRENACRSQMAGAFARHLAGDRVQVLTGGSQPAGRINPQLISAMADKGIDTEFIKPQSIDQALTEAQPEIIVTMGCDEACPLVPGARCFDWAFADPADQPMDVMRRIRDEIEKRVVNLLAEI